MPLSLPRRLVISFTTPIGPPVPRPVHRFQTRRKPISGRMSVATVHTIAKEGFSTGTSELYDRVRPTYQPQALAYIRQAVRSAPPLNVVEIGAGTGIFTRALLAHPDWSQSIQILRAVEPSDGMRDVLSKTVEDPRVIVAKGTFAQTGAEDGWADLVVIAQAYHWCPNYEQAILEFSRVLKPNGIVTLIWNLEDRGAAGWVAQLRDLYEQHEKGTPQFRLNLWRATFSVPSYAQHFQPPEEHLLEYTIPTTKELVIDRVCSKSYVAVLPHEEKEVVKKETENIIERGDGLIWKNKESGVFEYPYKTYTVVLKKIGA